MPNHNPKPNPLIGPRGPTGPEGPTGAGGGVFVIQTKTSNFAASVGNLYLVDTTAGDVTATLDAPSTTNAGQTVILKKIAAAHAMIVASSALLDGVPTEAFSPQWTSLTLCSTGSTWAVL